MLHMSFICQIQSMTYLGYFLKRITTYSFIQTFIKYLLSTSYMSGSVPGIGGILVKQRDIVYNLTQLTR